LLGEGGNVHVGKKEKRGSLLGKVEPAKASKGGTSIN